MRVATAALAVAALFVLAGCAAPVDEPDLGTGDLPDPESDVLGWEAGYWHNETLAVTVEDGLNDSERTAVVRRGMARVEQIRGIEFEEEVEVTVISRDTYREQIRDGGGGGDDGPTRKEIAFEAMFLVGERGDAGEAERETQAESVLGFYSPGADEIVVIAGSETPTIAETVLGHELVHAAQFRTFDPQYNESTTDLFNAKRGLIEGDARYVDARYADRCGTEWRCVTPAERGSGGGGGDGDGGGGGGVHRGIALLNFFPYSDGPAFVASFRERGGWARVNDLYDAPPATAEQVAVPRKYGEDPAATVNVADRSSAAWERVRFDRGPDYDELGVAGITAMFAYPAYRGGEEAVISPRAFLNPGPDGGLADDPINYTTPPVAGWEGDALVAYRSGDRTGYVWQLAWESPGEASEFATTYRELLDYWGAEQVREGVYRIPEGEFADAFRLSVSGTTVTVTNAPTVAALDGVRS